MHNMRVRSIDVFRGLSISLMVFFTIISRLSNSLPDFLLHNVRGTVHIGDFVLPMFLFASGMSLVFFDKKRKERGCSTSEYVLDIVGRIGKFVIVWMFISPFSSGEFLGMDELMLSVLLFIPSVMLVRFSEKTILTVALLPIMVYLLLYHTGSLPDFTKGSLGGYGAASFYLPVMLAGVVTGKQIAGDTDKAGNVAGSNDSNTTTGITGIARGTRTRNTRMLLILFGASAVFSLVLCTVIAPDKMNASPSFMALSVALSLLVFAFLETLLDNMKIKMKIREIPSVCDWWSPKRSSEVEFPSCQNAQDTRLRTQNCQKRGGRAKRACHVKVDASTLIMFVDGAPSTTRSATGGAEHFDNSWLEYLGRKPLRYWVLMFVAIIIPLSIYLIRIGVTAFPLGLEWMEAAALSALCLPYLYVVSLVIDGLLEIKIVRRVFFPWQYSSYLHKKGI